MKKFEVVSNSQDQLIRCRKNLDKLGLSLGNDLLSPETIKELCSVNSVIVYNNDVLYMHKILLESFDTNVVLDDINHL